VVDPAAGRVSMPKHRYLLNSLDAVQGGAMALVGEVAAAEALAVAGATDVRRMVVTDLRVSYLTLGRVGPIVTRTRVLGAEPVVAGLSAVVELVDAGADDRVTTVIMVGAVALDAVEAGAA
jgi:acyl-coenzyme A thioesterase PaaI-like protein